MYFHSSKGVQAIEVLLYEVLHLKDTAGMANSVNSDQTAPKEQSDLNFHCLLRPVCPNT